MPFAVLPALIPDIKAVYDVYFAAFADDPVTHALFPNVSKEDLMNAESEFRKNHTTHVQTYWQTSTTQYTLKCIDTTTGAIVGMGLLDVYPTPSDWKPSTGIEWLTGKERERAEELVKPLWDARHRLWDEERYLYNHLTAVLPSYQRKGVGRLITEFGIKVAEAAQLPVYLESSKEGAGLYEKCGFKKLEDKVVHRGSTLWPEKKDVEDYEVPLMVWVPEGREDVLPKAVKIAGRG